MKREYVYNEDGSVAHELVTFDGTEKQHDDVWREQSKAVIEPVTSSPVEWGEPVKSKRSTSGPSHQHLCDPGSSTL